MVERACHILSRLPARPPDILQSLLPNRFDNSELHRYFTHSSGGTSPSSHSSGTFWNCLQVVASINTIIIRMALKLAFYELGKGVGCLALMSTNVDANLGLLKLASQLAHNSSTDSAKLRWVIVKAFLWSSWQRSLMLYYWDVLRMQLSFGFDFSSNKFLAIQGLASIPELFVQHDLQQLEHGKKTPYMCRWAYELLRNDRACVAMDLCRFHECYSNLFGDTPARCMGEQKQCDGRSSESCRRFTGTKTVNQSAHDWNCQKDCKRFFWDKESFVSFVGPKAVCVQSTDDNKLRYRRASGQTLAISHVWSHGQGGRSDHDEKGHHDQPTVTGFNACLHSRYANLAGFFGCDSYWMDTPCIPEEEPLRSECISNINWIFTNSKVTLVCDQDLMKIDITALTMEIRESILAVLLVCDWNVRAWTLLESMRGRNNIHLLCKRNQVICFQELLRTVHQEGRIDIATLFLTSQHLLPHPKLDDFEIFPGMGGLATDEDKMIQMGFISVSEGAILLSHRHASRAGDDILIWSLLVNQKATKNVGELWKSQLGKEINTGFLLSSAPRIQGFPGLSWAPCSPTLRSPSNDSLTEGRPYLSYDGTDTRGGVMTPEGLQAEWLVHAFPKSMGDESIHLLASGSAIASRISDIAARYLEHHQWGALLRPCRIPGPRNVPAQYRGNAGGPLLAVCGSNDRRFWEWIGVYDWDADIALPEFNVEDLLLV